MQIAILGAAATGKTQLMHALAESLGPEHPTLVCVADALGATCDLQARMPGAGELSAVVQAQMQAVEEHADPSLLLCDGTPLLAAIYCELLWDDASLVPFALEQQGRFALTLLTGLDLACSGAAQASGTWTLRNQVDQRLRQTLTQHGFAFATVYGQGKQRAACALQAIAHAGGARLPDQNARPWTWPCEKCSDPDCEHRLFSALLAKG